MGKRPTVWIHEIPRGGPYPFHDHGKPTPWWHDYSARELSWQEAVDEGAVPCQFCFPEEHHA